MENDNLKPNFLTKKKKKTKYNTLNTKNWGINFDKNEYQEIVLSNSNRPDLRQ